MIRLFSADVCPFAQRTRALLTQLGLEFQLVKVDLDNRDEELLKLSPTGKVPLFLDGKLKLYESQVINDYLAEKHDYEDAYHADPGVRAREKLAMVMWDQVVGPAFYQSMRDKDWLDAAKRKQLNATLQEILHSLHATKMKQGSLLAVHCAPFWARIGWLSDLSPVAENVAEWMDLKKWLDAAVQLPAIQATLPDQAETVQRYRKRFAGASS